MRFERSAAARWASGALCGAGFAAVTLFLAARLNIWQDEWYSLRTTSGSATFALHGALYFERIPPLYPMVLELWRALDRSVLWARALSILCVGCAALASAAFARRYFRAVPPAAVAAAVAFNPFSIFAAVEIRLYALVLALSALLVVTFFAGFVAAHASRRARVAFVVTAIAAVYTQYFLGAFLLGGALALGALGARERLRPYALALACVAAACVPLALVVPAQLATVRSNAPPGATSGVWPLFEAALAFALPHDWLGNWFSNRWNLAYDCALLALVVGAARGRLRGSRVLVALTAIAATYLVFFVVAPVLARQTLYFPRHAAALEVPVLLLAFGAFDALERRREAALRAYLATYALFALLALGVTYRALAKAGDFERAAAFIGEREAQTPRSPRVAETIYVFDQEMAGPLAFYYRGHGRIVPLPAAQDFTRFDARAFALHDVATVRARFGPRARGARLFLYRGDVCYDVRDPFGCRFLEEVVRRDYRVLGARALASAEVRELERR